MSASETTAMENNFLNSNKRYIEEVIEDSDAIQNVLEKIYTSEGDIERNYDYAIQHADDIGYELNSDFQDEIDSLKNEIEDLKQMIEELTK